MNTRVIARWALPAVGVLGLSLVAFAQTASKAIPITVYKSATCGCCAKWNDHLRAAGFRVSSNDVADTQAIKDRHGVPSRLRTCHTALVGGYVVEGHVPADVIRKLLRERPKVAGIAVPGMPMGSPGMEGAYTEAYQVLTFDKAGSTTVYATR